VLQIVINIYDVLISINPESPQQNANNNIINVLISHLTM